MSGTAVVRIVGAQVACAEGAKEAWKEISRWVARQLYARFGDTVAVEYFDLFDPGCPPVPPNSQLPLVSINGEIVSSGGKISMPAIRKRLEELGVQPAEVHS